MWLSVISSASSVRRSSRRATIAASASSRAASGRSPPIPTRYGTRTVVAALSRVQGRTHGRLVVSVWCPPERRDGDRCKCEKHRRLRRTVRRTPLVTAMVGRIYGFNRHLAVSGDAVQIPLLEHPDCTLHRRVCSSAGDVRESRGREYAGLRALEPGLVLAVVERDVIPDWLRPAYVFTAFAARSRVPHARRQSRPVVLQ